MHNEMYCICRDFRSSNCNAHCRIKPSICDHFGQDETALICLLEKPDVCESQSTWTVVHATEREGFSS